MMKNRLGILLTVALLTAAPLAQAAAPADIQQGQHIINGHTAARNCSEIGHEVRPGDPEYRPGLDRDKDGIGCEGYGLNPTSDPGIINQSATASPTPIPTSTPTHTPTSTHTPTQIEGTYSEEDQIYCSDIGEVITQDDPQWNSKLDSDGDGTGCEEFAKNDDDSQTAYMDENRNNISSETGTRISTNTATNIDTSTDINTTLDLSEKLVGSTNTENKIIVDAGGTVEVSWFSNIINHLRSI